MSCDRNGQHRTKPGRCSRTATCYQSGKGVLARTNLPSRHPQAYKKFLSPCRRCARRPCQVQTTTIDFLKSHLEMDSPTHRKMFPPLFGLSGPTSHTDLNYMSPFPFRRNPVPNPISDATPDTVPLTSFAFRAIHATRIFDPTCGTTISNC